MKEGSKYLSILLSTVTLFGPISYLLYAFYESGRLTHFGAPVEFIQLTSFGILPVIETIHPGIILTAIVFTTLGGMKHATPLDQFRMGSCAVGYVAAAIAVIASNEVMKWVFGLTAFLCGLIVFFVTTTSPDLGNEEEKPPPIPSSGAEKYTSAIRRGIFIIAAAVFFCIGYVAAGVKQAQTQIDYWMSGDRVALAIYGNIVLLADLNGKVVGPNFEILETAVSEAECNTRLLS
ncbi:hypothetical protein [Pseudomonas avellanae]|uniref:hypothetical protein n=2 Tax=Pseudomonas avellanae TaxID=46257 RepID=UPI000A836EC7|nr:hypothetical protein [Pseudomonas avellanae]UQW75883.1 hypothetical protein L2Y01_08810 [Pseudomonas avellanae]